MRHWLTPRVILIASLLLAAPGAALAHLLVAWVPQRLSALRLVRQVRADAEGLDQLWEDARELHEEQARLRALARTLSAETGPRWLPRRDRHRVFERLATAFRDERVALRRLTLGEPELFAVATDPDDGRPLGLLACEPAVIVCSGSYAGLTACFDRLSRLELPIRLTELSWGRNAGELRATLQLEIPFLPEGELRRQLAEAAGLEEDDDS